MAMLPFTLLRSYIKFPPPAGGGLVISADVMPWTLPALCRSYGFPTGRVGGGVIAIIELGGGYRDDDVNKFFSRNGLPKPIITNISVSGGQNTPGSRADAEVALDMQVAGGVAGFCTGRRPQIRMYWTPNSIAGMISCITQATADGCDVCSISWGNREDAWPRPLALQIEAAAAAAAAKGMVIFAASGDNNSGDGGPGANVDLPASAPHIVGCGGTMRPRNSGPANPETVWNNSPGNASGEGSGGGFSKIFPGQPWQVGAPMGGRMVPDISANGDPNTGFHIILNGQDIVVGGTSADAPFYAGFFSSLGRKLGFVTPKLWQNQTAFRDILVGDNGFYRALPGPDPASGLGTPYGSKLADLFAMRLYTR